MATLKAARGVAFRIGYGALFALALPVLLVLWTRATERAVNLPALHWPAAGSALVVAGVAIIVAGWAGLWNRGGGLPMNAFPPPNLVSTGIYALLAHPIYLGFCLACCGFAVAAGSSSGLWLVTPITALCCAALVLGHEGHDLRMRFGPALPRPVLSLPENSPAPAGPRERVAALLAVAVPWIALYEAAIFVGPPRDSISTFLPFEARLPVFEEAELVYASTYLFVLLAIFAPRTRAQSREWMARGLLANALVFPLYFALPLIAPPRPLAPHGTLGWLLSQERAFDSPAGAFPSFHVLWALLAAEAWSARWPRWRAPLRAWAWLIAASCLATGMHSLLDVLAGAAAFAFVVHAPRVWESLRALAEWTANCWLEWRIGPVRVLGYGFWAALGNLIALSIVAAMVGPGNLALVIATAASGLVGSLLWAQLLERPAREMRPYGFYGGLFGIIAGACVAPLFGTAPERVWVLLAGYCCAAPFVQSLGRVRCLMQGCCHGAPASEAVGIRYFLPSSRVCKAGLGDRPLHPTPLYSILWNGLVALAVLRLWSLRVEAHFLCGIYLVLSGLGRFVEESYRGEPQTPIVLGLRMYQWIAIGTLIAGAVITAVARSATLPSPHLDARSVGAAAGFALVTWLALGVDFPGSRRRFGRLA